MFQQAARGEQRLPDGVVVASFPTYAEAQAAVNTIAESDAEVAGLAIVGNDLKLVERVMGRLTWGKVALGGLMRGLSFGIFFALAIYLLMPESLESALILPLLGAAIGILLAIVTHAVTRKHRDFASVQQVLAARYDVVAPQEIAGKAMHLIGRHGASAAAQASQPAAEPTAAPVQPPSHQPVPVTPPVGDPRGPQQP